jgi:hypothetical protein
MKNIKAICLTVACIAFIHAQAQTPQTPQKQSPQSAQTSFAGNAPSQNIQPRIMVIPYTKEGEDIRNLLEDDVNKRVILAKIKEAFDNRGFTTVDFNSRLKAATGNAVFAGDNKTDLKALIIQMSGADVYVETEIDVSQTSDAGSKVKIILQAYEAASGNSLANKVGESHLFSNDIGMIGTRALEGIIEDFLNVMQEKFTDIVNNGKTIVITIGFDPKSKYDFSSSVGSNGGVLADEIELWMAENTYKNYYHLQGTSDTEMYFDDVRIPLRDPATDNNFTLNRFAMTFYQFLRSLGLQAKRDVKGNTLFITIQ